MTKKRQQPKAEPMPGLLFSEAPAVAPEPKSPWDTYNKQPKHGHSIMWAGVIAIAVIIIGLWGWSLKLRVAFFSWSDSGEYKIFSRTKTDWNKIFSEDSKNDLQDAVSASQVKTTLQNIIATRVAAAATNIASSTATTAAAVAATTTVKTFPSAQTTKKKK